MLRSDLMALRLDFFASARRRSRVRTSRTWARSGDGLARRATASLRCCRRFESDGEALLRRRCERKLWHWLLQAKGYGSRLHGVVVIQRTRYGLFVPYEMCLFPNPKILPPVLEEAVDAFRINRVFGAEHFP